MTVDYTSASAVMDALAIDATDVGILENVVSAITNFINNQCGRDFRPVASSARYFDPLDSWCLPIDDASAVAALATDNSGDGSYATVWSASDWVAHPVNQTGPAGQTGWPYTRIGTTLTRLFTPPGSTTRPYAKVTAVWGWATIPDDISLAALMVAEETFKAVREAPFGSANMADFGPITIRGNRRVDQLLGPYKTMTAAGGAFLVA